MKKQLEFLCFSLGYSFEVFQGTDLLNSVLDSFVVVG